jgi:AcrR family transcriptional regulator
VISVQIPKEQVKKDIIAAARDEFLVKGYEKASIRAITSEAKTSTTNVYNYFKDKDALFRAVVEPTLFGIKKGLEDIRLQNRVKQAGYSLTAQKDVMVKFINYIFDHKEDLELLLFHSAGSSLSSFKNVVIRELAAVLEDWIKCTAPDKEIPDLFTRSIAGFYVSTIESILLEEKTREQVAENLDVYLKFIYGGWNAVL